MIDETAPVSDSKSRGAEATSTSGTVVRRLGGSRVQSAQGAITFGVAILAIAALYFARAALMPIALALLLSFLLAPLVKRLRRWGIPRAGAVIMAVGVATLVTAVVMIAVTLQVVELVDSLPQYRNNIETKLEAFRSTPGGRFDRFMHMIRGNLNGGDGSGVPVQPVDREIPTTSIDGPAEGDVQPQPVPVEIVAHTPTPLDVLGVVVNPLVTAGIVMILVVFILLAREDIRNRFIHLLGNRPGQMYVTTQVLDDAAARVSRYLLMQFFACVCFAVPIGVGLVLIGVPNALLWGLMAFALRFVPYIGPWVAALFPVAIAFAVDPGWSMVCWTILLFVVVELVLNNIVEPWLYATSTGMSPVGVLLSTVFWASLWGPVGLVVATPLTACLVALGKYIPGFGFFTLLLGDQPAMSAHERVYQRLLAMDPDEPDEIAQAYLKGHSVEELCSQVLIPVLKLLRQELHYNSALEPAHHEFMITHLRNLIEDLADRPVPKALPDEVAKDASAAASTPVAEADGELPAIAHATGEPERASKAVVLCMPANDESDELVALMVAILLHRRGIAADTLAAAVPISERIRHLEDAPSNMVCVCTLPPFGTVHTRNMVRHIRSRVPAMSIVVAFCDEQVSLADLQRRMSLDSSVVVVTTLGQALEQLQSRNAPA